MVANINMRGVQESVEDSAKQVREMGRKALLASLGVAGLGYDLGVSVVRDGGAWLEKAEKRGKAVENDIVGMVKAYRNDFPGEVKKVGSYVQKLSKNSATAVVETVEDIQVNASKKVTKAVSKATTRVQDTVKEMKVAIPATVQNAVEETAMDAQAAVDSAVENAIDALWSGYDELSVKDIVAGLDGKSINVLEQIRRHEIDGKYRVTVVREIDAKLQAMTS